jgi:hypothetical protein
MTAWWSGRTRRLASAAAFHVAFALTTSAHASDLVLVWDAPAECPSGDVVEKHVRERLGSQAGRVSLRAHATVIREETGFRVRLQTFRSGQRGVRELAAPTCEALVDALAVIVALAVEPDVLGRNPANSESNALESDAARKAPDAPSDAEGRLTAGTDEGRARDGERPPSEAVLPEKARDPGAQEPDEAPDTRAFTDLGLQGVASFAGAVESGLLPGLGFGVTLRGGARLRRFRLEVAVSRWFTREAAAEDPRSGAHIDGLSVAGFSCFRAVPAHTAAVPRLRSALPPDDSPAIEAGPCVGVELGQLRARSYGVSDPGEGTSAYAAAGGALRLGATAADWLSLDVRFEGFRMLHRPDFRVANMGIVHEPDVWSIRAALGVEAYFP